jgi:hypothetical protein
MGQLTPGATYIYEKSNGITYARELGAPPSERFEVGRDFDTRTLFGKSIDELEKIVDMMTSADNNPALKNALERALTIYELSKEHSNGN